MFLRNNKLESIVGVDATFNGDLAVKGTIKIDGSVVGNIDVDWLILGEKAFLQGDVNACGVVVDGKVEGNIAAKESVGIKSKGHVRGDIRTAKLTVDEGGIIDGMITMSLEGSEEKERKNENCRVIEFKNDKNPTAKIKNINFKDIKLEELKSS